MGDAEISTSTWKLVEVGRVVLFIHGPHEGKLATIVEIIDHKRALVDGPASNPKTLVPRHAAALSNVILTPIVIPKLPRATGTAKVRREWVKAEVEAKWAQSAWQKRRDQREKRKQLTDFERFKVVKLRKQARFELRRSLAKVRAAAK
ncbi:MAG: hypothetical protein M1826_003387 [Phylliscum demangeonii]|nr:MAG: hypothetical protein M1826_003387 [Phylliscum demangeonii]